MVRWWIVGLSFTGSSIPILYFAIEVFHIPEWLASLVAAEISNIVRFFVNDRWVFGFPRPTWKRFGQYHVATAGSFFVWQGIFNLLIYGLDIESITTVPFIIERWKYLIVPLIATACSVFVNMLTNFLWIWRKKK